MNLSTAKPIYRISRLMPIGVVMLQAVLASGCNSSDAPAEASSVPSSASLQLRQVGVAPVERRSFERQIRLTGSLQSKDQARLRALVDGPLEAVLVEIGDSVSKGQVLARTRPVDARLALEVAESAYEVAKADWIGLKAWRRDEEMAIQRAKVQEMLANFERLQQDEIRVAELHASGNAPESERDAARAAAQVAAAKMEIAKQELTISESGPSLAYSNVVEAKMSQADSMVQQARQKLADTEIRAPFSGIITFKGKRTGDFAKRGEEVVELTNIAMLEAEFDLSERFSDVIVRGLPVQLEIESAKARRVGEITAVNQTIDPKTRTFLAKVELDNQNGEIKAGAFCVGILELPTVRDVLAVPMAALQEQEGRTFVWVVENDVVSRKFVQTGERDDGFVEISDGLTMESVVVISGTGALVAGDVVSVKALQEEI